MRKAGSIPYLLIICLIFVLCAVISKLFFRVALIEGVSMEPTYRSGQLVIINKIDENYKADDAVLFYCEGLDSSLVKRIVACPGDTVHIKDGTLIINGKTSTGYSGIEYSGIAEQELTVPTGYYFLLGDNLNESIDSRYDAVGLVSGTDIEGKVM